jgi:hypothetical protein
VKWWERKGRDEKGREGKGSKLWWGCEGCVSVVKSNEGKLMVKCGCISPLHNNVFHYCYCLVYSVLVLIFLLILIYLFIVVIVFALYSLCVVCPVLCV